MFVKSRMMSGTVRPTWVAEITLENCVVTLAIRLTVLETAVDCDVPALSMDEAPVLITVAWLSAVDAPEETTVSVLVREEIPVEITVAIDFTDEMPSVAVDSEPETCSHRLFSVETWAEVEPVVVFD